MQKLTVKGHGNGPSRSDGNPRAVHEIAKHAIESFMIPTGHFYNLYDKDSTGEEGIQH